MELLVIILIIIGCVVLLVLGIIIGRRLGLLEARNMLPEIIRREREDASKRSRSVLGGLFSEQLAPYLPGFEHSPTEVRFIGKPIDFIVFKGMDGKEISEVIFVEVKTGKSTLSAQEKNLKATIENGNVRFEEYRVPEKDL